MLYIYMFYVFIIKFISTFNNIKNNTYEEIKYNHTLNYIEITNNRIFDRFIYNQFQMN